MSERNYTVVGKPVSHSLSPDIHAMFAAELDLPVKYVRMQPEEDDFEGLAKDFFSQGGKGMNVSFPYKERAFALADSRSSGAQFAQAANTLKAEDDGTISACNTDGPGLLIDITKRHNVDLNDARVLVVGAGGAAAGIMLALIDNKVKTMCVTNRTLSRAQQLIDRMAEKANERSVEVMALSLDEINASLPFDVVIHTTSAGHGSSQVVIDEQPLKSAKLAYDLSYGEAAKPFVDLAKRAGARLSVDGLGMLVEQAALSFAYWEGVMPSTDPVLAELRRR